MDDRASTVRLPEHVSADLSCSSCGYNLRTLAVAGKCPECGRAVSETIRMWRSGLGSSGAVRSLREFAGILAWTPMIGAGLLVIGALVGHHFGRFTLYGITVCAVPVILGGVYYFCSLGFVATCSEIEGRTSGFLSGFLLLCIIGMAASSASTRIGMRTGTLHLGVTMIAALAFWTARAARRTLEVSAEPSIRRSATTTSYLTLAGAALLVGWIVALSGAIPVLRDAAVSVPKIVATAVVGGVGATTVLIHIVFMFRLRTWLANVAGSLEFIDHLNPTGGLDERVASDTSWANNQEGGARSSK